MSSSDEECPTCRSWGPDRLALYQRGCPRCGRKAEDADLIAWMRRQVDADLARWVGRVADLLRLPEGSPEAVAAAGELEDATWRVNDAQAKLTLLERYAVAMKGGGHGYDHRTGRPSEAEALWGALSVLAGGYRGREGWRGHWFMPQAFQGY